MALRVLPDAGAGQEGCLLKEPRVQTNKKIVGGKIQNTNYSRLRQKEVGFGKDFFNI